LLGERVVAEAARKPADARSREGSARTNWFVVQPRLVGHGPTLFAGLSKRVDLTLVSRLEFGSGAVPMRYESRVT
jgi:hypothetical protein